MPQLVSATGRIWTDEHGHCHMVVTLEFVAADCGGEVQSD